MKKVKLSCNLQETRPYTQGRIQDFLKGGSENLKKGIWSVAPEAIGIVLLNIKIIHLHEHM